MSNKVHARKLNSILCLSGIFLSLLCPRIAHSQSAYFLANNGSTLVSFDLQTPGTTRNIRTFANGFTLESIDFRPSTGLLYGYDSDTESTYTVDSQTGSVSLVDNSPIGLTSNNIIGADFDPRLDRFRVVTANQKNVLIDPTGTDSPVIDPALKYASGDIRVGATPFIVENAYTNNVVGTGLIGTTGYAIDANLDSLARLDGTTGTLFTVGSIGPDFDVTRYTGFDILTSLTGANTAYAILDSTVAANDPRLYTIDLETGALTEVGAVGSGDLSQVYGLAVAPLIPATVPEASSITLVATMGLLMMGTSCVCRSYRHRTDGSMSGVA